MTTLISVIHIVACVFLVVLVLIQSGKGAEISASFAGSSQTVFGSSGGANFFTRATSIFATTFMITSLLLVWRSGQERQSVFTGTEAPISAPAQPTAPAGQAPANPAAPAQQAPAAPAQQPTK